MEFQTSHSISKEAFKQRRDDLHQSMRSKEKPELNEKLGELIAADIKNNIEAKRLSEYERYDVEPLTTTEKPVLTTQAMVAKSINEGLIDDFSILEEAGSENKQTSRIQIKKGSLTKLLHNKKLIPAAFQQGLFINYFQQLFQFSLPFKMRTRSLICIRGNESH